MENNYILISGRAGAGKTELILSYCNQYATTTLLLAEEYSQADIRNKGLSDDVTVIGAKDFKKTDLSKYGTVCIDYVELFDTNFIKKIITILSEKNIRIIALSQMRSDLAVRNIFKYALGV